MSRRESLHMLVPLFFFNDTATTEIYTLSLHDALPISCSCGGADDPCAHVAAAVIALKRARESGKDLPRSKAAGGKLIYRLTRDRKSTRLNSSHSQISYAVFCLKKKKESPICGMAQQHW